MRKEQTLLVVCVVIGGLLIWSATGKYSDVGAAEVRFSSPTAVKVVNAAQPDPGKGLSAEALKGRSLSSVVRTERRPDLPPLVGPGQLPPKFVRLVPTPGPKDEFWRPFRAEIVPLKPPAEEDAQKPSDQPTKTDEAEIAKPKFNAAKVARLVRAGGEEVLIRVEPTGAFKGHPDWELLEKWPNVTFKAHNLKKDDGSEIGAYDVTPEMMQSSTLKLAKTLENEFYEERIGRHVRDDDREALLAFGKWVFNTLPTHVGVDKATGVEDKSPYGLAAVTLAIREIKKAQALLNDLAITKLLGECCRAGFDPEGEINAYIDYMKAGRGNDLGALKLVGDEYYRQGALEAAREHYQKAAATGDAEARLKLGLVLEREGKLDAAADTLKPITTAATHGGRALLALARVSLAQAKTDEAAQYVEQAKKDASGPELNLVLGAVQYAQGKFPDAEKSFAAAKSDEPGVAWWRSDRGMALVGKNTLADLDAAKKEFNACLDQDPLNLLDPLFGLGDYYQRLGDGQHSNDFFETALARAPDNSWILLRLATLRLRDGQPDRALAMGTRLLEVSPGCTDGLLLVGRAAASLEKPDLDKAITHLRRAVDKETDNKDFVNEYARALLSAGKVEEAIKVLDAATDVNKGFGRSDARLLALAAWARFVGKRPIVPDVLDALQRGQRANPDDATKEWLETVKKALLEWNATRVWQDDFDRPPSSTVGNAWREQENLGISIQIDAGRAVFRSTNVKNAAPNRQGATVMDREEDLGKFKEMRATFKCSQGVETTFGLHLGPPAERDPKKNKTAFEIALGCDRNGFMEIWVPAGKQNASTQPIIVKDAAGNPRPWPMDDFHTVRIVRKDDLRGIFEIWLDDEQISVTVGTAEKPVVLTKYEHGSLNAQQGRMFALGFVVDADAGAQVDVAVDMVQVTKIYK